VRTADGGATWQPLAWADGFRPTSVSFFDALHGWASGPWSGESQVRRTDDGGQTWAVVASSRDFTVHQVQLVDERRGYALAVMPAVEDPRGRPALADGGITWSTLYTWPGFAPRSGSQMGPYLWLRFTDAEHGWAVVGLHDRGTAGVGGTLWRTNDGGQSWVSTGQEAQHVRLADGSVWARSPRFSPALGSYHYSPDGGTTWQPLTSPADEQPPAP
jgi:photosystem II stability/assembly factor-like uncharacterized protein